MRIALAATVAAVLLVAGIVVGISRSLGSCDRGPDRRFG